jgi:hypothetical protein
MHFEMLFVSPQINSGHAQPFQPNRGALEGGIYSLMGLRAMLLDGNQQHLAFQTPAKAMRLRNANGCSSPFIPFPL